ncbi:putative beta-ketoacyl-[acyl-carrier-protein] synthase I [Helianthus annuus]|uniref:Beta-ketoacyl-[acyl-carrier-protein] synthase I n=1 Tax=Helianthus annuus TaxID=4232 RepID=A0A9K3JNN3_HELAN|nr:putative beta-ketoacyl-[acyl-carrier-protein] synthase I [Helianthus annuus]
MAISPVSPAISLGFSFTGRRCIFRHSDTRSTRLLAKIVVGNHKSATVVTCGGRHHVQIHDEIDKERAGVLVGTGIGGLTMFSDGVQNLIEKGYKKITHFHSLRHNKHGFGSARY